MFQAACGVCLAFLISVGWLTVVAGIELRETRSVSTLKNMTRQTPSVPAGFSFSPEMKIRSSGWSVDSRSAPVVEESTGTERPAEAAGPPPHGFESSVPHEWSRHPPGVRSFARHLAVRRTPLDQFG
mgnify:FL=1